jgi:glycosyltransferase involved in cell wall biosynthesis
MRFLFVHQNFPGQYLHLVQWLARQPGNEVVFITQRKDVRLPGVRIICYEALRQVHPAAHNYLRGAESHVINGQAVARVALKLKQSGFQPDLMVGHSGWGEILYLRDVFDDTPLLGYFEFFYRRFPRFEQGTTPDTGPRIRTMNITNLLSLEAATAGMTPTRFQHSLYPDEFRPKIHVLHEGIDTGLVRPDPTAMFNIPDSGIRLEAGQEVMTYVARNLEPQRGFPSLMRALPAILARRPNARVLVVGGDETSYGPPPPNGRTFREIMLEEVGASLDTSRVHFLGRIPYPAFLKLLQVSRAHLYLTHPFVLSWSMLEAMASGCLVIGSDTEPVQEVIEDGVNGQLVDFFDINAIVDKVTAALAEPQQFAKLRQAARESVIDRYDLHTRCLPAQLALLRSLT